MAQKQKGIIQFYLPGKGYGYVRNPISLEEFYFSKKSLLEPVEDKEEVVFEIREGKQGLVAVNICKWVDGTEV